MPDISEIESTMPVVSPLEQKRQAEREKMERLKMSKKLDEVFGVIRSESVEDIKTQITVRGMGDINLNRQKIRKTKVEHNKLDEYEQKRVARQQISMPDKPATYKKPKPKVQEIPKPIEEPKNNIEVHDIPKPIKEPKNNIEETKKEEEKPPPKKKSNFVFIPKPESPPTEPTVKQGTPDLQSKFWPILKLPTPDPQEENTMNDHEEEAPENHLPVKIGINGFDQIGRLAFRAAFDVGLDVSAINDPFIPLHYMVYSLKFDMAHSHGKSRRKDFSVSESPEGHLIVNGKTVTVFKELDPRRIPWNLAGVNYVIEATQSLQSKVNARHHLEPDQGTVAMNDIINRAGNDPLTEVTDKEKKPICSVKKVILASNSTEFPSFGVGVNDDRISRSMGVIANISAQANALILPLKIIFEKFGIRYCSYTLLKAIMGPNKDIKCPSMGPSTHRKIIKWDFAENLIPAPCPALEEETLRFLPSMRGRLHGIVVYTPVPQVSMFDLTVAVENGMKNIYQEVCKEMKRQAESKLKNVLKYVCKVEDQTSASCLFTGSPHSVVFDEGSGCQIDQTTVKMILWFDNEYGFANRIVDLVKKAYQINTQK